jgi:hypothetical protein
MSVDMLGCGHTTLEANKPDAVTETSVTNIRTFSSKFTRARQLGSEPMRDGFAKIQARWRSRCTNTAAASVMDRYSCHGTPVKRQLPRATMISSIAMS